MRCRNCGSDSIVRLKNGAAIAPFFAFRVFGIRSLNLNYKSRRNRLLNIVTFGLAGKIARKAELYADAMLCESCHFYSIWNRIPNESLDALYIDYRAADYDSDREQYEPGYIKNISDKIGKQEEAKSRLVHQAEYFKVIESAGVFKASDVRCALDWGGADGRFLPRFKSSAERFVYEISNIKPISDVVSIKTLAVDSMYDYIQLAHVLEHVASPRELMKSVSTHLIEGGYVYLEVPLEVDPRTFVRDVKAGVVTLGVHEHINKYTEHSLSKLVEMVGLQVIDVRSDLVDFVWAKLTVIRLMGRKKTLLV